MHIAICDDNVADRKQTERLMGREADKWIAKGTPLYIYSYGSVDSLLANMMKFDAVFLDISLKTEDVYPELIEIIASKGMDGAFVLSKAAIVNNCRDKNVLFLNKPIKTDELHDIFVAISEQSNNRVSLIELRGLNETFYIHEDEMLYAVQDGEYTDVTLTEGRKVKIHGPAENLYEEIREKHENFVPVGYSTILNMEHVASVTLFSVRMDDGERFRAGGEVRAYIKHKMFC